MECTKCSKELSGKQQRFCSSHCSKLYLKSQYRKRNREKIRAYKKDYKAKNKVFEIRRKGYKKWYVIGDKCRKCGTTENLTVNHIIPLSAGGADIAGNIETLCNRCNILEYHIIVRKALKFYFEHNVN